MIIKFKIQLLKIRYFYTIHTFVNIEEITNTLREFQAENDQKFKNTQADFKKIVSYIKFQVENGQKFKNTQADFKKVVSDIKKV